MRKAAEILKDMDAIVATAANEKRDMTAAEIAEFDKLEAEHKEAVEAESVAAARTADASAARVAQLNAAHERQDSATAIAARNAPGRGAATQPKAFESLAEFFAVALSSRHVRDARLERGEYKDEGNNTQSGYRIPMELAPGAEQRFDTGSAGGYMIPQQRSSEVLRIPAKAAIVRPRARIIPAGSPPDAEITFPALDQTGAAPNNVFGGVMVFHEGEGNTMQETDFDLREVSLKPKQLSAFIKLTNKALLNSAALGALCAELLPSALNQAEDFDFLVGSGIGRALGALNASNGAAYNVARTTGATLKYDDFANMASRIMGDGVWLISRSCYSTVLKIQDNSGGAGLGQYIFNAQTNEIMGFPVVWTNRQATLGGRGDVALVDLSYYLIKDGSGPFLASSDQVYWTSNRTAVKIVANVDGQPWLTAPFKNEDGYETSPFVVLAA